MSQNGDSRDTRTEIPDGLKAATAPKIMRGDPNLTYLSTQDLKNQPIERLTVPKK